MNLTELENEFRFKLHETAVPTICPQENFINFINEAEREACRRSSLIFDKTTAAVCEIAIAEGDQKKDLHVSILEVAKAYLVDADDNIILLSDVTFLNQDFNFPTWRDTAKQPDRYMVSDKVIELDSAADADYTMKLEVYRLPLTSLAIAGRVDPDIAETHHRKLLEWAWSEYYTIRDTDAYSPKFAAMHEKNFSDYFGPKPTADRKRKSWSNKAKTVNFSW